MRRTTNHQQKEIQNIMRNMLIAPLMLATAAITATGTITAQSLTAPTETETVKHRRVADIVSQLNVGGFACTKLEMRPEVIGARESGDCTHKGDQVVVTVYNTAEQRQEMTEAFGDMMHGVRVAGPDGEPWQIGVNTPDDGEVVRRILGGSLN